jgi:cytochrome c oxidase subunit 2
MGAGRVSAFDDPLSTKYGKVQRVIVTFCGSAVIALADPARPSLSPTNIFAPVSTPAQSIFDLSRLVLMITGAIFVVVFALLAYAVVKFRKRSASDGREPAQVYGSTQVELAWTVSRSSLFWSCSSRRHA